MINEVEYNPSLTPVTGAVQIDNILIATGSPDFSTGNWVGGVDDSDGYVIVGDTTSSNLAGWGTGGGTGVAQPNTPTFWKATGRTDNALIALVNKLPGSAGNYANINDALSFLTSSPFGVINYTGGGAPPAGNTWYFYSDEGPLNAPPPSNNGEAIFKINSMSGNTETFNPNNVLGLQLFFYRYDSNGVDYETQFMGLQSNGGTLSVTQNGQTATYTTANPNMFVYTNIGGHYLLMVNTNMLTQTAATVGPFVYNDPITLTIS